MVPRTPHLVALNQSVREWPMVVSTMRGYREQLTSASGKYDLFAINLSLHHAAIRNVAKRDTILKIQLL